MKKLWIIILLLFPLLSLRAESVPATAGVASTEPASQFALRAAQGGSLETINGVRVLKLKGVRISDRGFAHGYLLAPDIRDCLEDALKGLPFFSAEKFTKSLVPWATKKFDWDPDAREELQGLWEGLKARLTEDAIASGNPKYQPLFSERLGRDLTADDLYALSAIGDYFGPACSGFTVSGALTQDGQVIHGRNLDFPIGPKANMKQIVIASYPIPEHKGWRPIPGGEEFPHIPAQQGWVGIGWPGLIAIYSAMNEKGLTCCLHDANNVIKGGAQDHFVPRGLLLRRMVESIDPYAGDPALAAQKMAAEKPVACGNLFHLSWPKDAAEKTKTTPAAVLEFDSASRKAGTLDGVSIRRMDNTGRLVLTNHYCVRAEAQECKRFSSINQAVDLFTQDGKTIGEAEARKILISAEMPLAAHSVVFWPDARTFYVSFTRGNLLSTRAAEKKMELKELLKP